MAPRFRGGRLALAHQRCSVVDNRTRAPGTQARRRQPAEAQRADVHRSCPVPGPHRDPLAGPARRVRQLECRLSSLSPLGKGGLWERLWHRFQNIDDDQLSELFIDSTVVRAHQHAAGASKKRWATSPGSGPPFATAGGLSTKLHAACIDERTGVSFVLTGGQRNDAVGFEPVWEGVPALPGLGAVVNEP